MADNQANNTMKASVFEDLFSGGHSHLYGKRRAEGVFAEMQQEGREYNVDIIYRGTSSKDGN